MLKKLVFIEAPHTWTDRVTVKTRNVGVERIVSYLLIKNIINESDYACYDFTFNSEANEQAIEQFISQQIQTIPSANFYCFSAMETNYEATLQLAKHLKQKHPQSKVIIGGPAATELKKEILEVHPQVDIVIPLPAEESVAAILSKQFLQKIPNLIIKENEKIIATATKYPPATWQQPFVRDIHWNTTGKYINDQCIVPASLGCIAHCDFCVVIKKEPILYERETKQIVEEIKQQLSLAQKRGHSSIYVQLLHQNFCHRLHDLINELEKEQLLEHIHGIGFNSRADTFLVERNKQAIISTLEKHPELGIEIFIGIENYQQTILDEIGKTIKAETNIEATKTLLQLRKNYSNFRFQLSFIGITPKTTREDLQHNLEIIKDIFTQQNILYPVHLFFQQPLRLGVELAKKYHVNRKKGHYAYNNFNSPTEKGNCGYPENKETAELLQTYYGLLKKIPSFYDRKKIIDSLPEEARTRTIATAVYCWGELFILQRLLDNLSADDVIASTNHIYRSYHSQ